MLNDIIEKNIRKLALKTPNEEICGCLVESGTSTGIIPCRNISSNRSNHFEISPFDYLRISENNKIVGIYHSQFSENPSSLDVINSLGHNLKSYFYSISGDRLIEITDKHLKYGKYLNRNFEINKNDCFSLIRDFYKNEFKIYINNYERNDKWYLENPDIIKNNYMNEGFVTVEDYKEGDILVFKNAHFGIYLEGDLLLHHARNKKSTIEQLTDAWKKMISNIYRHNV